MSELKPCPFCGAEAAEDWERGPTGECYVTICCTGCGAAISFDERDDSVAAAWNTRAAIAAMDRPTASSLGVARAVESRDCPLCNGDCGAANPPVMDCPMRRGER